MLYALCFINERKNKAKQWPSQEALIDWQFLAMLLLEWCHAVICLRGGMISDHI